MAIRHITIIVADQISEVCIVTIAVAVASECIGLTAEVLLGHMLVLRCCYQAATVHIELISIAATVIGSNSTLVVARIEGVIVQQFYCAMKQAVVDAAMTNVVLATDIAEETTTAAIRVITQSLEIAIIIILPATAVCTTITTMLAMNLQLVMLVLAAISKRYTITTINQAMQVLQATVVVLARAY